MGRVALWAMILIMVSLAGCESCRSEDPGELPPRLVEGTNAPYSFYLPSTWRLEPAGSINPDADVAAHFEDRLFLLVIPQALPSFPRPDVHQLKREAVGVLEQAVEDLRVERQGPLELDGVSGLSVFALGTLGEQEVRYVTAYVVHEEHGYQIIGFADAQHQDELLAGVDSILATWRFGTPEANVP